jgi:exodeoxyribonuclease VII large subunit
LTSGNLLGIFIAMDQLPLFQNRALSVTDLTRYIREIVESDEILRDTWVLGEISNLTRASSGHIYLTLKDAGASLKCVIWKTSAARIRVNLQNGMAIEAHGAVGVYEPNGVYQFYVDVVRVAGEGLLYQEFLRLKARLESEGLFEETRKRPIPAFPRILGIVTSPTGAALQDMLNTLRKRFPLVEVILAPTPVQGDEAPPEIVKAIQGFNHAPRPPDVILVARGGGSLEDLWAFNDERVVRAIAGSQIPVVTGIGHETDFTLSDFAADLRAPTPTGAATLATPDRADLRVGLDRLEMRLSASAQRQMSTTRSALATQQMRLERASPLRRLQDERQNLDQWSERAQRALAHLVELRRSNWQGAADRLQALNPLAILERGYAVVQQPDGSILQRISQAQVGQPIQVQLADGRFDADITQIERMENRT